MQNVTPWPESFDVSQPVARVLVDGKEVDVESVTVSSELDSAMPERVAGGGGGVVAATGTATVLRADDVAEAGFNPWGDAQQFVNASEVVVEAGYRDPATGGVGCARQVTGQVESLDGGVTSSNVGLEFVDSTTMLDRDITIEPLLQHYPPLDGVGLMRGAGLSSLYITDRILRHCGFYATPPMVNNTVLSAPMMGSLLPERGRLDSASAATNSTLSAVFSPTPWGLGCDNGVVTYSPDLGAMGHGRLTSPVHVSFHRQRSSSPTTDNVRIDLRFGSTSDVVRIMLMTSDTIVVRYVSGGVESHVVTLQANHVNASEAFSVVIQPSGHATIHASNGVTVTGHADLPSLSTSQDLSQVFVRVPRPSHVLGGLQVAFSDTTNHTFKRTAHLHPPGYRPLPAFPAKLKTNCLALLKEQAEAELAAMWIDEFGHFQWRNRYQLQQASPVGTLTSMQHLFDISWEVPVRSVFSRVELEHQVATITRRDFASVTVSDSGGSTLSNGDTEDRFFEPPANQDWHQVTPPQWMGGSVDYAHLRRGRGSYHGGVVVDDDNNERLAYSSRLYQTWEQINPQRWLLHSEARNLASTESIEQSLRDRPDLYGRFAEENLPIIRAKGLVEWTEDTITGGARGPVLAPVLTHPVGPWIQNTAELRSLADWLADLLTKPDVILRRVPIVPDPRIQLGDVFWLEDQTAYHVRARIVVMGKTLTYQATNSGYEMSQEITCRVIDVERLGVRYDELEAAWAGRDYDGLESAWSGQNYDAFESDPLDRS